MPSFPGPGPEGPPPPLPPVPNRDGADPTSRTPIAVWNGGAEAVKSALTPTRPPLPQPPQYSSNACTIATAAMGDSVGDGRGGGSGDGGSRRGGNGSSRAGERRAGKRRRSMLVIITIVTRWRKLTLIFCPQQFRNRLQIG